MEFWFFRLCVHYGLRIFRSLAYVFRFRHKYLSYGFRIWFPKWFSDFPIWIPVSLRSKRPLISNSRETSVCSFCQHCIGSTRVLRTGMWTPIDFDGFAWGFRFWSNFFCGFAVVDNFFDGLEVPNRPSHPSVQWSSTRVLVLQIENLSF